MNNIWYFEEVNLFKILCPHKFAKYENEHTFKTYNKGEFVYFSDDASKNIFLIAEGKVKILNYTEEGNEVVKGILAKGELFGELVVLGEEKRTDYAQASDNNTVVCQMDVEQLKDLMKDNKEFAFAINKIIGLRIRKLERRLDALVFKDVRTRLVEFIKDLSEERGKETHSGILVEHFYTHKDMADLIGTSRQTVTTIFNDLKGEQLLDFTRKEISIPDLNKLS